MADDDDADIADLLAHKRRDLETQLETLSTPPPDTGGISFGKRVGDGTSIAVERLSDVASYDRLRQMLADVVRAEDKLVDGTYGRCDIDDEPIDPARLEALPWATRCLEHASVR
ncbi:MAG: TraR/DksA C4-type zinc finger protein [Candidatus Nanopelagicales bacterium]